MSAASVAILLKIAALVRIRMCCGLFFVLRHVRFWSESTIICWRWAPTGDWMR